MLHGIINVFKPKGFTSHDVVAKVRGILRERRIGHTGTLDPEAEGVLPLCVGKATKVVPYLSDANKCYIAEVILGSTTTTEDSTGEILETKPVEVSKKQIEDVVAGFVGSYTQIPPMYSAIKINGVRLYELARAGVVVERPARTVQLFDVELLQWIDEKRFKIKVSCSKGTYIRTLCTDIGEQLGCGAHMGTLLRTEVGRYKLEDCVTLEQLQSGKLKPEDFLQDFESIFGDYPKVEVIGSDGEKLLYNGNALPLNYCQSVSNIEAEQLVRMYDSKNTFIGLYKWEEEKNLFKVEKMFL